MKKFIFTSVALLISSTALAKVESQYSVSIFSQNSLPHAEMITALDGWSCNADTYVSYSEYAKNHKGKVVRIPKTSKSQGNWSTLFSDGQSHVSMPFVRDLYNSDPTVNVSVQEQCSKTVHEYQDREICDEDNRCHIVSELVPVTKTSYMRWNCAFSQLPSRIGQDISLLCKPQGSSSIYDIDGYLNTLLRQKEITATIKLNASQQTFARDFCREGEEANAAILHFEQGLGGHSAENDFELEVTVNNELVVLKSANGIYSEDIRVCPAKDQRIISIGIKAFERDLKWDDEYKNPQSQKIDVDLKNGATKEIEFVRKSYSLNIFTPKRSTVRIQTLK